MRSPDDRKEQMAVWFTRLADWNEEAASRLESVQGHPGAPDLAPLVDAAKLCRSIAADARAKLHPG